MRKILVARRITVLFSFLFLTAFLYAGGVLSSPRKVYVIKTNHFEIMFPKESAETAHFVAQHADSLYEKAKAESGYKNDFSMPLIISPDSSELNVVYTTNPYNRIVIYDSVAEGNQVKLSSQLLDDYEKYTDGNVALLSLLYKEIFRAVSCSIRSPLNEFVYKYVIGDPYQPIPYVNLPFAFVSSFVDISAGVANDQYYQQLLIQAKIENKFPDWFQISAIRDIYPGNDLCFAAATGFSAFLMQRYGLEKYTEFWHECGNLHPYFMRGIFHQVYELNIEEVWKEFETTVPTPQNKNMEQMLQLEKETKEVSENDRQGAFQNVLYTSYGIVWYDSIRHEVDIFDSNSIIKIRQLLFIADDVHKLSLSPDGRYVSASFIRNKSREELKEEITYIYDLKKRVFLKRKFELREVCFLQTDDEKLVLAGLSVDKKIPELKVYSFLPEEKKSQLLYEKSFDKNESIFSLTAGGKGNVSYLYKNKNDTKLVIENIERKKVYAWQLSSSDGKQVNPFSLQYIYGKSLFTFSYYPEEEAALVRSGYIQIKNQNDNVEVQKLYLQNCDMSGGVYYPVIAGDKFYYSAHKSSHDELRYLPLNKLTFVEGKLKETSIVSALELSKPARSILFDYENKKLGEYKITGYNLLKYMTKLSFMPLFAVCDITLDKGPVYWPALGMYITLEADPMRNTEVVLSGSFDFLKLSFEKEFNIVPPTTQKFLDRLSDNTRKFNFAAYLENSSTPVDISAGAMFNFNQDGDYNFKALAKTAWKVPVGSILRDFEFSLSSVYTASSNYYDKNKIEYHPPITGWVSFADSYELLEVSFAMTYSNTHQYGISQYEKRGLVLGTRIYSLWDIYEINQLNQYRDRLRQQIQDGTNIELTEAQLENLYIESFLGITQLNMGVFAVVEIPRLVPFEMKNGWIFSLPTTVRAELMNTAGAALNASVETLLIGNEIQDGLAALNLFCSRMGLKAGYAFNLVYDTTKILLPDIRHWNYLAELFSNTVVSDSIFMTWNTNFQIPAGNLSRIQFNMDLRGEYFLKTNGFKLSFNVSAAF